MAKQLEEISSIPVRLDKLIDKMEKSNAKLASDISFALRQSIQSNKVTAQVSGEEGTIIAAGESMPSWMKWTVISALIIIAVACIFNVVVYFFPKETQIQTPPAYIKSVQSTDLSAPVVSDTIAAEAIDNALKNDSIKP